VTAVTIITSVADSCNPSIPYILAQITLLHLLHGSHVLKKKS
jgi:hypothetical protein